MQLARVELHRREQRFGEERGLVGHDAPAQAARIQLGKDSFESRKEPGAGGDIRAVQLEKSATKAFHPLIVSVGNPVRTSARAPCETCGANTGEGNLALALFDTQGG